MIPGPDQIIRVAVGLPLGIARRVFGLLGDLVPGGDDSERPEPDTTDVDIAIAADDAMTRDRDPIEEAAVTADDGLGGHVEPEVELVAESTDPEATQPPGPEIHIEDRR